VRRGLRYLPVPRRAVETKAKGRRRLVLLGTGVVAALSLVWQQQATLASFLDAEYGRSTFTAATLRAITPTTTTSAATATVTWAAASGSWATPQYVVSGATTSNGADASTIYTGANTSYTQTGASDPGTGALALSDITAGGTHACGIARGQLYCWGNSAAGALGLGSTVSTSTPTLVSALSGKVVTDVSAGTNHTCAVADGAAYCWGNGGSGRLGTGSTGSLAVPTAVTASGVLSGHTVTSITAGDQHSCAVADGAAYCWGLNTNGQLGNTSTTTSTVPVAVTPGGLLSGRTVTSVSAGTSHSCAVADGVAFCWGLNTNGRLGDTTTTQRTAPVAVSTAGVLSGRTVTAISAGGQHSCAVADGDVYCWGYNSNGQLGNSSTTASSAPVAVVGSIASAATVSAVSAGVTHSCAVADGAAYCWGAGASGQIGNGSTTTSVTSSVAVTSSGVLSGRTLTAISAGNLFTCTNGATPGSCWGAGASGQLGNAASSTSSTPVDVKITGATCPDGAARVDDNTCSLVQGTDYYARLGYSIGTWIAPNSGWVKATTSTRPAVSPSAASKTSTSLNLAWPAAGELYQSYAEYTVQRSLNSSGSSPTTLYRGPLRTATDRGGVAKRTATLTASQVSVGTGSACAILEGSAYCWGDNVDGQLGNNSTTDSSSPTAVLATGALAGKTVTALSAGMEATTNSEGEHTCAVADGGVYCWGNNSHGELGNSSTTDSLVPVAAGTLTNVTDVATGYMHTCALTGGKVYCWGDNSRGQLGDGSTTTRSAPVLVGGLLSGKSVTAIATGAAHTCAIAAGTVYCWGSNVSGQLGINSTGANTNSSTPVAVLTSGVLNGQTVTAVAAGEAHTCVIASGKAYCWGYNAYGQVGNASTNNSLVAVAVSAPWSSSSALSSLSAGQYGTCLVASGKAYCWGYNTYGQVGNNSTNTATTPAAVTTSGVLSGTVDQVAAGTSSTCALSGGSAYCWGYGNSGRLGNGGTSTSSVPVTVTAVAGAACATGASLITPGTCSLTPGTTYYYRVKFTVDGAIATTSDWVGIKTSG
jgi:alpha-tubulin suppressor-like RCC1 family protein